MTRVVLWSSSAGDVPANLAFTNNFAATTNPGTGNDSSQGYSAGSEWINTLTNEVFKCTSAAVGAAVWELMTTGSGTPGQVVAPAASTPTGAGSNAGLTGGAGGATSGAGGNALVAGGAGSGGNANGGDVVLAGGAPNGTGVNGVVREEGVVLRQQGAPNAQTVSATLTAANILTGIITVAQGAAGASALQLPLATAMDTALPSSIAGDAFDFSLINISTNAAEPASITTNTGWTLVGDMDVAANSAATTKSAARLRARKTGTGAWTLYRLS
jgi:hypothetical protein